MSQPRPALGAQSAYPSQPNYNYADPPPPPFSALPPSSAAGYRPAQPAPASSYPQQPGYAYPAPQSAQPAATSAYPLPQPPSASSGYAYPPPQPAAASASYPSGPYPQPSYPSYASAQLSAAAAAPNSYPLPPPQASGQDGSYPYPAPAASASSDTLGAAYNYGYEYSAESVPAAFAETAPARATYDQTGTDYGAQPVAPEIQPCAPSFMSTTAYTFPNSSVLKAKTNIPYGVIVTPLAPTYDGQPLPAVNFGSAGVVRCEVCRSYINPYVSFLDRGSRWRCNFCTAINNTPHDYQAPLDSSGRRTDLANRPELTHSSIEIVAPAEYMRRAPQPPVFLFVIDVSVTSVTSGLLTATTQGIRAVLDRLPGEARTMVGFITYDSTVHFYNLKSTLKAPQMLAIPEIDDIFLPSPDDLLVDLQGSKHLVEMLLDNLPRMFAHTRNVECAMGPAINAAAELMNPIGGKCCIFASGLPSIGAGALKHRQNPSYIGTEKEHLLYQPAIDWYKQKAVKCNYLQIGFDVFLCSNLACDVATLNGLAKYTGGQTYYYPGFHIDQHGEKFKAELARNLTREQGFEAVVRIRCSKGIAISNYHGNFLLRGADLLSLPIIDADKTFALELRNEEIAMTQSQFYIQSALLYSTSYGERRIRVHTMNLSVSAQWPDLMASVAVSPLINLMTKQAVEMALTQSFRKAREYLQNKCLAILRSYRISPGSYLPLATENDYPDTLRPLPMMILALLKHPAFRDGTDVGIDQRAAILANLSIMNVTELETYVRPRLLPLHILATDDSLGITDPYTGYVNLPPELPLSSSHLTPDGLYLLDNGMNMLLRVGNQLAADISASVFSLQNNQMLLRQPAADEPASFCTRVHNIINFLRQFSSHHQDVTVIMQEDPSELKFFEWLIEDRTMTVMSYVEFLQQISRSTAS